ncbi:hypothetical protein BP6252_05579 [Coleophoma cylindrospora]|uniref:SnoaL-like domain-containing protein n=1 Tax=Coleophoma cylindrospora TaxID=1849047 RepID=A0A3D8RU75_9HELO|nr:hypothetical protein BP6252_05579 [Coleophoma cylindrospora]
MAENSYFEHKGSFPDDHSRENHALRFMEHYVSRIDSADYKCSYLPYYHPQAVFHDTTGVDYVGGPAIWEWISGLFGPMSKIEMETVETLVISKPNGTHVLYMELMSHFWLKSRAGLPPIDIPRSMVFTLGPAAGEHGEEADQEKGIGFEGLQIVDARLYYDRSLLLPHLVKSKQEVEKFGPSGGR